jgi:UDP-glucose 4-epimerase
VKVVIPGVAGQLGRLVARRLVESGHDVFGIDVRPWRDAPVGVVMYETDVRKRGAEDVFRRHHPDAIIHMATVTHLREKSEDRFRINLGGTRAVFENAARHGVKRVVFVGRHTYYGAAADSPLYHTEDEPPIATMPFPELADLVAADLYAGSALWRLPQIDTAVLRVCYTLGASGHGTLAGFLSGKRVPTILGYDPLFQFMHEKDVAAAIALSLEKSLRGVFNVAGPPPLPLSVIVRESGRTAVPLPEPSVAAALGRFGLPKLTAGALAHIKYSIVIDASSFKTATGFVPAHSEADAIRDFRIACPPPP